MHALKELTTFTTKLFPYNIPFAYKLNFNMAYYFGHIVKYIQELMSSKISNTNKNIETKIKFTITLSQWITNDVRQSFEIRNSSGVVITKIVMRVKYDAYTFIFRIRDYTDKSSLIEVDIFVPISENGELKCHEKILPTQTIGILKHALKSHIESLIIDNSSGFKYINKFY